MWMMLNTFSFWFQLVNFFADFNMARSRLNLIGNFLNLLEVQTLATSSASASSGIGTGSAGAPADTNEQPAAGPAQAPAEGGNQQQPTHGVADTERQRAWDFKKLGEGTLPFDFVVTDTVTPYKLSDKFSITEWHKKCDNMQNWHATVAHLRAFVSTSRLTAQTLLAAAAVIGACVLIISLAQFVVTDAVTPHNLSDKFLITESHKKCDNCRIGMRRSPTCVRL